MCQPLFFFIPIHTYHWILRRSLESPLGKLEGRCFSLTAILMTVIDISKEYKIS